MPIHEESANINRNKYNKMLTSSHLGHEKIIDIAFSESRKVGGGNTCSHFG